MAQINSKTQRNNSTSNGAYPNDKNQPENHHAF